MKTIPLVILCAGCLGKAPARTGPEPAQAGKADDPTAATAAPTQVFDHDAVNEDPFAVLERVNTEGPPELSTRLHGCTKMKIATLRNVLGGLGVDLSDKNATSAAGLLTSGAPALGEAVFAQRTAEALGLTTATAVKMFDIFVQAAPEIIAAMPTLDRCMRAGQPTTMFDSGGRCTLDGLSCLRGAPANDADKTLCDEMLDKGSTNKVAGTQVTAAQAMAVGVALAAAHTCE